MIDQVRRFNRAVTQRSARSTTPSAARGRRSGRRGCCGRSARTAATCGTCDPTAGPGLRRPEQAAAVAGKRRAGQRRGERGGFQAQDRPADRRRAGRTGRTRPPLRHGRRWSAGSAHRATAQPNGHRHGRGGATAGRLGCPDRRARSAAPRGAVLPAGLRRGVVRTLRRRLRPGP